MPSAARLNGSFTLAKERLIAGRDQVLGCGCNRKGPVGAQGNYMGGSTKGVNENNGKHNTKTAYYALC